MKRTPFIILVILIVLTIDQCLKIYVKTNFTYGDGFNVLGLSWCRIHFVENKGMAFGLSFGGVAGKYVLSLFRIFLVGFLIWMIRGMIKTKESKGLLFSFAMIIAGAIGNIIDSAFYGLIFSESKHHGPIATMFPEGGGYGSFLQGKVVDMLYFPLINTRLPEWLPIWGGDHFSFFNPVFNVADSAISIGVVLILLFYRNFFSEQNQETQVK